jgi:hypothetical protein
MRHVGRKTGGPTDFHNLWGLSGSKSGEKLKAAGNCERGPKPGQSLSIDAV